MRIASRHAWSSGTLSLKSNDLDDFGDPAIIVNDSSGLRREFLSFAPDHGL